MTEIGNRSSRSKAGAKGVKIERIYTTPGVHPYDEVTWEKRDVVQQNWKTGETIFEQRGVEFPDFWSVNASTIVTTKYFRGAVGTAAREVSLKQLIDRVVLTYAAAGKSNGYFAAADDAEIEAHEVGMAVLEPLRELDEVAYLRFASVYQAWESLEDFEGAIALLRAERDALGEEPGAPSQLDAQR